MRSVPAIVPEAPRPSAARLALPALLAAIVAATGWPIFRRPQLDPDDYRYLHHVQRLEEGFSGHLRDASIVENRWDHLWWIGREDRVRFFRPVVVLSYFLDARVYGASVVTGLFVTNLLLHAACVALAACVIRRWAGRGPPLWLGAALFAAFACHDEVLWYAAGRTESLAALGFLGGLALHAGGREHPRRRFLALPAYAFALLAKELAIGLPLVCLAHDLVAERRDGEARGSLRRNGWLYAGYAAVAAGILALRAWALAGPAPTLAPPYFVSPASAGFPAHLWLQFRSYGESLFLGAGTPSLVRPEVVTARHSWTGLAVTLAALTAFVAGIARDRRFALPLALGLVAWIPASVVYLSTRYLYLPSVAVAAAVSIAFDRLRGRPVARRAATLLAIAWIGHQGTRLAARNFEFSKPRIAAYIEQRLRERPPRFARGATVLVFNLPGGFLHSQFAEEEFRWALGDPTLRVRVISPLDPRDAGARAPVLRRDGPRAFVLAADAAPGAQPVVDGARNPFDAPAFAPGRTIRGERLGFEVEVIRGAETRCDEARFVFPEPLERYAFYDFRRPEGVVSTPP